MADWKHLSTKAVLAIHEEVLAAHGGMTGIREKNLLESALAAPRASMFGKPLFKDPIEIAAAYLFYICKNHPFLDGNKRTALAAALVFLHENGLFGGNHTGTLDVSAWEKLVLDVASGAIDRGETTGRLVLLMAHGP